MNYWLKINPFGNLILFILLIFVDQISKYLIRLKGGFYICNIGISWGIKIGELWFWLFWGVTIVFLLFLFFKHRFLAITVVLSGAISNLIDRLTFGCVVDFIDLKFWPVFNLADIFIVAGAIFLLVGWKKI